MMGYPLPQPGQPILEIRRPQEPDGTNYTRSYDDRTGREKLNSGTCAHGNLHPKRAALFVHNAPRGVNGDRTKTDASDLAGSVPAFLD